MNELIKYIIDLFSGLSSLKYGKEIIVFIISLAPILELRGGLIASSLLGLSIYRGLLISFIGNLIPIPFILLFISKILEWMENSNIKWMKKLAKWIHKKANKNKSQIEKYGYIGLMLFVGIPLPGTGAWTGCLVASLLELDKKKSFIYTLFGLVMASIIMIVFSYGILKNLIH